MTPANEQRVRTRAFEIWEAEGRPVGRQQSNWDQAVRETETWEDGHNKKGGESIASIPAKETP